MITTPIQLAHPPAHDADHRHLLQYRPGAANGRARLRKWAVAALVTVGASLAAASPAAAGGNAGFGCPPGFDIGAVTLEQALALPRVQAAFAAGVYDADAVIAAFTSSDRNANGVICIKDIATLTNEAGGSQYLYETNDDNASAVAGSITTP